MNDLKAKQKAALGTSFRDEWSAKAKEDEKREARRREADEAFRDEQRRVKQDTRTPEQAYQEAKEALDKAKAGAESRIAFREMMKAKMALQNQ